MKIIVLAKHAPDPESEISVASDGKSISQSGLVYDINDWDRYAVEEAIRIKEEKGGEVVVVGVGTNCDDTLRKCLAMGADRAIKIPVDTSFDAYQTAEVIKEAIKDEQFDMIFAGLMSQDLNNAQVGVLLAAMLDLPVATAVAELKVEDGKVIARRELEGGYLEEVELPTPCVLTIQSGINEPRYVSIMGIKRAKSKEMKEVSVTPSISTLEIEKMYLPPVKKAEMIEGDPSQIAEKIIQILKERGLI
ncbi:MULTISPECIES: electron transfer flavoprotein subunit beta/FixA family protein [Archaeoglobus]|jgi:electron transfer flavoprotein beta subunit|uniref:Electron transfer flavoprotein, subunit beta (EtfB) n=3 Tax=Archaeoglobus fulgidus TaxID=2234 RepID=O29955_ARCFU|nr:MULTISPECIES: electron transfer flavoprotein subunit beta/FixA family protein [Archaeoglobus]AAB90947.1 electron transfer flavoprotein, subunit beta (etfB) [Archaeoglobus fulgidus DSM 4304]AIG97106.1 Electron transfer flavoprotein, beta subunit [Archaeoglobus fulgidus DSM 8774]KUJ94474.1 MAG: Electron transfer flavoprotein, subunit beta (EtfB) [Archaeoglobus fulgidus]KUK05993.1 MAG: Electron transfer flavoprotein, subunit beta (EtfB) [Archaeoglobus fulgidus]MDI3498016.1 electron transfer fl